MSYLTLHLGHLVLHAKNLILNFMYSAMWHIQSYVEYHVTDTHSHKLYCIAHVLATQWSLLIFIMHIDIRFHHRSTLIQFYIFS